MPADIPVFKNPAPLAVVGAVISVASTIISLISLLIDIIKYLICYTIFFTIVFVVLLNLFKFAIQFQPLIFLANRLLRSQNCQAFSTN